MLNPSFNPSFSLPTEEDLPYTDDQPVDNELQWLIPFLLRSILGLAWRDRNDWFLGMNIGLYYELGVDAIGPDALLSLGVPTFRDNGKLRLSYVVWHENNVMPQWVLELVSQKKGGEYDRKFEIYQAIGILYYVIYNPNHWRRDKHDPFEVYKLIDGQYVRQEGNPVWMPELGLGIGVEEGSYEGHSPRDWLYWYDADGNRLPTPDNAIAAARQQLAWERQQRRQAEQQIEQEQQQRRQAEQQAEQERRQRRQAEQQIEQERLRTEQERQQRLQVEQQMQTLMEQLKARGINPEDL
jgi:Uma2 family endonuclease